MERRYHGNLSPRAQLLDTPLVETSDGEPCKVTVDTGPDSDPKSTIPLTLAEAETLRDDLDAAIRAERCERVEILGDLIHEHTDPDEVAQLVAECRREGDVIVDGYKLADEVMEQLARRSHRMRTTRQRDTSKVLIWLESQ